MNSAKEISKEEKARQQSLGNTDFEGSIKESLLRRVRDWSSHSGAVETNPTRNHEVVGLILGLAQWVKDLALS